MRLVICISLILAAGLACRGLFHDSDTARPSQKYAAPSNTPTTADADRLLQRQPGCFVPNLGQWQHSARFVHRSGPMTVFLEDRGWVLDLRERPARPKAEPHAVHTVMSSDRAVEQKTRGAALRMTFEGDGYVPKIAGEQKLPGHHNYFLGNDESRWRTHVPLYTSVRYQSLYPGIDLRLRELNGVPEYDLLLQPGADLSQVVVRVQGGQGLSIASDASLVIATALGPVTQPVPKTWQTGVDGKKRQVPCHFTRLGADRYGFEAPGWDGGTSLTIDPGLIWSTFLGGSSTDWVSAIRVDGSGVVTVAGTTRSSNFPTTTGAYDMTLGGGWDGVVSRLDPRKTGGAQLVYSTYLGGNQRGGRQDGWDFTTDLSVDASGVVTVVGGTGCTDFPTTSGAYNRTNNGTYYTDGFVSRLDPSKAGVAQLVYSTYLGGSRDDGINAVAVDASGEVTVAGGTSSTNFPTTSGAYDTTFDNGDGFVSRLDPSKTGGAQLVYSTYLGGSGLDRIGQISVDASGTVTVGGYTRSTNFPTTPGAYARTISNRFACFVGRLDPSKTGGAQLVYGTYLQGAGTRALAVDASRVVTVVGLAGSSFPTTPGAFDRTHNGSSDAFVSQLDPSKTGGAQLVYSTFLGGSTNDWPNAVSVDASGVVTVGGGTNSVGFPTTSGAYDATHNGSFDGFLTLLDPSKTGSAQLVYSTFLGGTGSDQVYGLSVDRSGVVTVAGRTASTGFPTTSGAYDTTFNGNGDGFISRLDMGVALYGDVHEIPIRTGGTQKLTVNAGKAHANRLYWIFGSITGTKPGLDLLGVHIPLNPDAYTDLAMTAVNGKEFTGFKGTLDANGLAAASFNVPGRLNIPPGVTLHHAYIVYGAGSFYMASNAVPVRLK